MDDRQLDIYVFELDQQCETALLAAQDVDSALKMLDADELQTDVPFRLAMLRFWTSLQTFLSAGANISKLFWPMIDDEHPYAKERGERLRKMFDIEEGSVLKSRAIRNHFEHFDERLDKLVFVRKTTHLASRNIGNPNAIVGMPMENHVAFYDTNKCTVTFLGKPSDDIRELVTAINSLHLKIHNKLGY